MRLQDIIFEARLRSPSKELLTAAMAWVSSTVRDRETKQQALLALRQEASYFLAPRYGRLYRGQSITDEQVAQLHQGQTIEVNMPHFASWTRHKQIALDYGEALFPGIIIAKRDLTPVLDIARIVKFFPRPLASDPDENDESPVAILRYAEREGEVICEHMTPLSVSPREVALLNEA